MRVNRIGVKLVLVLVGILAVQVAVHTLLEYRADVDLLVPESALGAVEQALAARGWQTKELSPYDQHYYREGTHELPPMTHVERDVEVDLHHSILPRTSRLKPDSALPILSFWPRFRFSLMFFSFPFCCSSWVGLKAGWLYCSFSPAPQPPSCCLYELRCFWPHW